MIICTVEPVLELKGNFHKNYFSVNTYRFHALATKSMTFLNKPRKTAIARVQQRPISHRDELSEVYWNERGKTCFNRQLDERFLGTAIYTGTCRPFRNEKRYDRPYFMINTSSAPCYTRIACFKSSLEGTGHT